MVGVLISLALFHWITGFMFVASLNFFILWAGFFQRHENKNLHARMMATGILSDLSLVLILEFQRDAVATALAHQLSALNQAHIYCSTVATLLYLPLIYFGLKLLRGQDRAKILPLHRKLGYLALTFRTLGYFLMFSMLLKK